MPRSAIRIAVVDDDASVRKALARLLTASSFDTKTYGSAREFMDKFMDLGTAIPPQCLVLDLHMPELSGLDLQHQLRRAGINIPTCLLYTSPSPRDGLLSRMPSSA